MARISELEAQAKAKEEAAAAKIREEAAAGRKVRGGKPKQPGAALVRAEADLVIAKSRAAERAERRARAAATGKKMPGKKPKDPAAAAARAEADRAAEQARPSATERTEPEAAADDDNVQGPPEAVDDTVAGPTGAVVPAPLPKDPEVAVAEKRLRKARAAAKANPPAPPKPPVANTTDPDSRLMKTAKGYVQGYNCQSAVNENQIVIACGVTQEANDYHQLVPMMGAVATAAAAAGIVAAIGCILADAGYWTDDNAKADGPDRLIATKKDWRQRKAARELGQTTGPPPEGASHLDAMEHRLRTAKGAAAYARRSVIVEPVFGTRRKTAATGGSCDGDCRRPRANGP